MRRQPPEPAYRAVFLPLVLTALLAVPAPGTAADFTLRAAASVSENDEDADGLFIFKQHVEAASNGTIEVDLHIGSGLCTQAADCLEAVATGDIDITVTTAGKAAAKIPLLQALDLPYLFQSDRVAETVMQGNFPRLLRERVQTASGDSLRLMTIGNSGGWRHFANTRRRVTGPEDLSGLKLRTTTEFSGQLAAAFGAEPAAIARPELFHSLQTGSLEATTGTITDLMSTGLPAAGLQYVTLDGHAYLSALWWMNNDSFVSLPKDLQEVVIDGFRALQQATFAASKRKSIQAFEDFVDRGGDLYAPTPAERRRFAASAQPVHVRFRESVEGGAEILDVLLSAIEAAENEVSAARAADLN
ncbi:TRAP transporter substrate-binding protein DctP [Algicella marina]|uniref:C4-dicarboxylate ABC transporter substrate-binding protein n=1 Tax=Algicella marina TaxID=2683284 RepID=A0A6P1T1B6_9RHOB|nr:TRAP transporter substrate-binding protein DctP [Algicella marina]QHQ35079.1 C4-dicarboxylate ABC transporter substrate-binding protein [Algicella marina]